MQKAGGSVTLSNEIKAVFQSMREGVLIIDIHTRILFANRSYLDFLDKTEEEIVNKPLREIRPGEIGRAHV